MVKVEFGGNCSEEASTSRDALSFRARAGRTKRERNRVAFLEAARRVSAERGWQGSRLEDVAREADLELTTLPS